MSTTTTMGKSKNRRRQSSPTATSQTLPSSPTHSSSSSDFEFTISLSPRTRQLSTTTTADELFYKGQLLPLHLSPRLSMVRTLLLASSSISSSSDTTTTASRDSSGSSTDSHSSFTLAADCDSSRPSSVAEEDEFRRLNPSFGHPFSSGLDRGGQIKKSKYFSLGIFSSVFRKSSGKEVEGANGSSVKRAGSSAKDVIRKYMKKVKPLYEKLSSQKQQQKMGATISSVSIKTAAEMVVPKQSTVTKDNNNRNVISTSFSGNLRYPRRRNCASSCPSSMRSSPTHSGVLSKNGFPAAAMTTSAFNNKDSSMDELQSAIQGAIAHCKNSMLVQNKTSSNHEI